MAFGNRAPAKSAPRPPPVKEGNLYELKIEDVGKEGDGIARINGFVIFVPNTKVGEAVQVRVTRVLRKLAFAEVVKAGGPVSAVEAETKGPAPAEEEGAGDVDGPETDAGDDEELEDEGVWAKEEDDQ
ncbi:MAG: TRAM domain-containing protein [Euryarchaeota archaeon]|nr:TRAM domain-containing protein [Euryarchaeota archaeon]